MAEAIHGYGFSGRLIGGIDYLNAGAYAKGGGDLFGLVWFGRFVFQILEADNVSKCCWVLQPQLKSCKRPLKQFMVRAFCGV